MAELITLFPWIVLLIVFVIMAALQWQNNSIMDRALARSGSTVVPVLPTPPVIAPPVSVPPVKPVPSGPFADYPKWFQWAVHEIGFHETGTNQGLDRYIGLAHCGANGDPWCAIFANATLEASGIQGSRSASSQSFRTDPNFIQLSGPAPGALVIYWRISKTSGQGHVGFYRGEDATRIWTLGGNENDMVQIEALPKESASFGLIGYWWPKSIPLPKIGPVLMPAGSPVSVQTGVPSAPDGVQSNITATVFGGQQSAYGPPIDDKSPGVALPFRFTGERPQVKVTKGSASVVCDIVDVGPWNINDPYWQNGSRPQAETGTDITGRHTNKAGIDLTVAAANAIQLDGKGLVNWQFVTSPNVV